MRRTRLRLIVAFATVAAIVPLGLMPAAAIDGACGDSYTAIHDIQGNGSSSPLDGSLVTTEGVVTHDVQKSSELSGFFLQAEDSSVDADPSTSEGIFVFFRDTFGIDVDLGDHIRITAFVDEQNGQTQLEDAFPFYPSSAFDIIVCATGVSVTPTTAAVPMAFETIEGMLVTFPQDLYISEFFNFDRFGEIVLTTDRQYQPSQVEEPGSAAAFAVGAANAANRITLDDNRNSQNPNPAIHPNGAEFTLTNTFRGGDVVQDVTGAIGFGFSLYRIQPTTGATYVPMNPRPTTPDDVGGEIKVASFNVLNFFTTIDAGPDVCGPTGLSDCRGADNQTEYDRQLAKLVAGIIALDADIVGLQEIENDVFGDDVDGSRKHDAIRTLVEALNDAEGSKTWAWVGKADHYNDYPIRNEIIYRIGAVLPIGKPVALADEAFDGFRPGDFEPLGRPPLAQTFAANFDTPNPNAAGGVFTVIVNHFKSKGSSCASIGDPVDVHQANCNLTRVGQAEALLAFAADLQASTGDLDVLIIGDLNSYAMEDPIDEITGAGYVDLIQTFDGATAYGYVFDGQLGSLDQALANGTLVSQVTGVTSFHINADEPDILDYDTSFKQAAQDALYEPLPYRASDHDPVIIGLTLTD